MTINRKISLVLFVKYLRISLHDFVCRLKEKFLFYKQKYLQRYYYVINKYTTLLKTINYMSSSVNLDGMIINMVKFNSNKPYRFFTLKLDEFLLQKYFDKKINPSDLRQANNLLKNYQTKIYDLAKEIIIPTKENIDFSLNGGALIGAFRHGGFIPWDDDLDFDLLRDDYDKFEKYLKENYIWVDSGNCKNYNDYYFLVNESIENNPNKLICLDSKGYIQVYKGTSFADCVFCDFLPWEFVNPKISFSEYKKWWYNFAKIYRNNDLSWGEIREAYLNEIYYGKIFTTSREDCNYLAKHSALTNFDTKKPKRLEKKSTFLPFRKYKFEDMELCIPNDYNEYLVRHYPTWQKVPIYIEFAKHIEAYNVISPQCTSKEFFLNFETISKEENYIS